MQTVRVPYDFLLNRRMRQMFAHGKLQAVRVGGKSLSLGGGLSPLGRPFSSSLVCFAKNGSKVGGSEVIVKPLAKARKKAAPKKGVLPAKREVVPEARSLDLESPPAWTQDAIPSDSGRILLPPETNVPRQETSVGPLDISKALRGSGFPPFEKMPDRLFKYAPPDWARIWATLADGLVYFASPLSFNDPYDCRIFLANTREGMQNAIQHTNATIEKLGNAGHDISDFKPSGERDRHQANMLANFGDASKWSAEEILRGLNLGIYCLSEKCDSLPMWAHYAKDHKGVCFVFNPYVAKKSDPKAGIGCFPLCHIWPVKYQKKMRAWDLKSDPEWLRRFFEKSGEWAYEKEWRAIMFDARIEFPLKKERIPSPPGGFSQGVGSYRHSGTLLGVILGCRMSEALEREILRIAASRQLAVWRASTKVGEYGLIFEPRNERAQGEKMPPGTKG